MQNNLNSNRTRMSIFNFQNEVNALLEQQEILEVENNQLKQRLISKNEDLLLRITNSLPKHFTDNFLQGLKKQSLHLDYIGDIAMSNILNDQFEATCSKQAQTDLMNLRSIIHIQREKLKTADAKIMELNDFIRQQDSLLTQTKELLKAKCVKIQLLEDQLQETNSIITLPLQSQDRKKLLQAKNQIDTEEEEIDFALQIEESRRSILRGQGFQGASCTLSPSDINDTRKENINFQYRYQNQGASQQIKENTGNSSYRVSIERNNSQRILQNNKGVLNNASQGESVSNSSRSKYEYNNNDIRKSQEKQFNAIENIIRNSKQNNSPTLIVKPNNNSMPMKQIVRDSFEKRGKFGQHNQENEEQRRFNYHQDDEDKQQQINSKKDELNQQNFNKSLSERSNSMKQLNAYIKMKQMNQVNNIQTYQCSNENRLYQQNNQQSFPNTNTHFERSPVQVKSKKDFFQIPLSNSNNGNLNQPTQGDEYVNKSNRSFCNNNNFNSSLTTESEFNVSYFLNQKLQQRAQQLVNNDIPRNLITNQQKQIQQISQQQPVQHNSNKIISNVISSFQKASEFNLKLNDEGIKGGYGSNQTANDQSQQSLFSNINFSNVFDMANASKPSNLSTLKTFNSINNQSQQQIYQPPVHPNQKPLVGRSQVQNQNSQNQYNQQILNSANILATLDTDPNVPLSQENNENQLFQENQEDQIRIKSNIPYINQQIYQEQVKQVYNQSGKKNQEEIEKLPLQSHCRNRSGSNYFNIYEQKAMNSSSISQDQTTRRMTSLNTRNDCSNSKNIEPFDNNMRNSGIVNSNIYQVQPYNSNQVAKTEMTPHKRQNSQSNGRRRSRAERLQKSTSSIKIYASNDYNTFNPLN